MNPRALSCLLLLVIAGCGVESVDDGILVEPCVECGGGAVLEGRFVTGDRFDVAAHRSGSVARSDQNRVAWLDDELTVVQDTTLDVDYRSPRVAQLAIDSDRNVIALVTSEDDFDTYYSLFALDPSARQLWRIELGNAIDPPVFALGTDHVFLASNRGKEIVDGTALTGDYVAALDRTSGALLWSRALPPEFPNLGTVQIEAAPSGGVIIAGSFDGILDVGGTVAPLTSTVRGSGFIASLDAAGVGRWAVRLDSAGSNAAAGITHVSVGPGGEVAVIGQWFGGPAMLLGTSVPPTHEFPPPSTLASTGQLLAMLDGGGGLRWVVPFGHSNADRVTSIATDGAEVVVGGAFTESPLTFDPGQHPPDAMDGFAAAVTAAGIRWLRLARGPSYQSLRVVTITDDAILAVISSGAGYSDETPSTLSYGDLEVADDGTLIAKLAR